MLPCCHPCWRRTGLEQWELMMELWKLSFWIRPLLTPPFWKSSQAQTPCRVSRLGAARGLSRPQQTEGFGSPWGHWMLAWDDHQPRHVPDCTVGYGTLRASLANSHMLLARKSQPCLLASVGTTQVRGSLQEFFPHVLGEPLCWNPRPVQASLLTIPCTNMSDLDRLQKTAVQKQESALLNPAQISRTTHLIQRLRINNT